MTPRAHKLLAPPLDEQQREELARAASEVGSAWRREALDEYIRLRTELDRLLAERGKFEHGEFEHGIAEENLDAALLALAPRDEIGLTRKKQGFRGWAWRHVREWLTGSRIEDAWGALHRVQEVMLMVLDEDALGREAPRLERELAHLPADDPAQMDYRQLITKLKDPETKTTSVVRCQLRDLLEATHAASDRYQRQVRDFRNKMFGASGAIGLFLLAIGVLHLFDTNIFSVCAGASSSLHQDLCPDGTPQPDGFDVLGVELLGAAGGLLSALVPLVTSQRLTGAPRMFSAQVALKVQTGALSGFFGVLLLEGGLLAGLAVQQGSSIYAFAAFFGLAQQVLTGFVDRKASSLAKASGIIPLTQGYWRVAWVHGQDPECRALRLAATQAWDGPVEERGQSRCLSGRLDRGRGGDLAAFTRRGNGRGFGSCSRVALGVLGGLPGVE